MKSLFLVILISISLSSISQKKWSKIEKHDGKLMVSGAVYGAAFAVNQAIAQHHLGRGKPFWDYNTSWKRKYEDYDAGDKSPAYFLSTTLLAPTTDGFHLTQAMYGAAALVTLGVALTFGELKEYPKKQRWLVIGKKIFLTAAASKIVFETTYRLIPSQ